jgi:hypothetical protein
MMKKMLVLTIAVCIGLPGLAAADDHSGRVADLEKQIAEMTRVLKSLQEEVGALKENDQRASKAEKGGPASPRSWTDNVTLNGQVRFRGYDLRNMWGYDANQDWDKWNTFRAKGSLAATVKATDDVTAVLRITNQTYGNGVTDKYGQELDNTGNKFFLDNAYVNVRSMFDLPVDLTLGRQDLRYGGGFVIFDGNSQFASSSAYFDGGKLSWHLSGNAVLDAFYMKDEENNRDNLSNDDIALTGLYLTVADTPVIGKPELYLLNRNDENLGKDIWTLGARVSDELENGFDYALEAAWQTGDALEDEDQEALGAKFDVGYTFKDAVMAPRIFGGFVYLGGDDPDTDKNEGWDVFYGGWGGIYGDLLAWTYVNLPGETNVLNTIYDHDKLSSTYLEAPFSNFRMVSFGAQANLVKDLSAKVSWGMLTFNETYTGIDDDFGDYYQATLKYLYNKQLSFSLYGALLSPGEAFSHTGQDNATELYWETDYKF